ncbi:MAG TPA: chromosomal replication initiator protein DnaA [Bacilli bacterium]|nr:chromosomal replication initiator protein DnaA [Bacilli bacterium]HQA55629.1 chromosomal replication initiator protein DnaA [Bacilli bacterium]
MINSISEITQLWDRSLKRIEERLGEKQLFDSFFAGSYINEIRGDTIVVVVNSSLAAALIKQKYYDLVEDVVSEITESNFKLEFILEIDVQKGVDKQPVVKKQQYFQEASLNPKLTFDNFVVGSFNREASQAALFVASNPGKTLAQPLFIYSNSGLGKTHLLHAIGNYIKNARPNFKILYISTSDFVEEYVRYVKGEKEAESLKDFFASVDVLLLDDVQMLANKVKTQEMFFAIYNKLIDSSKQVVITSDKQPNELNGLEDRLVTRFCKGLVMRINEPDQNTCVEILRKKIEANGLDLERFDDAVLYFFADKFSKNVRELEGALNRLIFYVVSLKQTDKITMDVAMDAVQSLTGGKSLSSTLSEQKIINVVSDYYNLTPSQLTGRIRTGQIALARHIAMYLIRITLDIPLKKIGDMFGGKDHTTVMSAVQKVDKELKTDSELKAAIDELQKRIKK